MAERAAAGRVPLAARPGATWQWQLTGRLDTSVEADVFDLDGFETTAAQVATLHRRGAEVVCYLDLGALEAGRPDTESFPDSVLGRPVEGWPQERYLDIRRLDLLAPLLRARLQMCRNKGFDAVEADLMDAYDNVSGFAITRTDQLRFIRWIIAETHDLGMAFGLKNVPELLPELVDEIDFAVAEECVAQGWCGAYAPLVAAGRPVFDAEYRSGSHEACARAAEAGVSVIHKRPTLDRWRHRCR